MNPTARSYRPLNNDLAFLDQKKIPLNKPATRQSKQQSGVSSSSSTNPRTSRALNNDLASLTQIDCFPKTLQRQSKEKSAISNNSSNKAHQEMIAAAQGAKEKFTHQGTTPQKIDDATFRQMVQADPTFNQKLSGDSDLQKEDPLSIIATNEEADAFLSDTSELPKEVKTALAAWKAAKDELTTLETKRTELIDVFNEKITKTKTSRDKAEKKFLALKTKTAESPFNLVAAFEKASILDHTQQEIERLEQKYQQLETHLRELESSDLENSNTFEITRQLHEAKEKFVKADQAFRTLVEKYELSDELEFLLPDGVDLKPLKDVVKKSEQDDSTVDFSHLEDWIGKNDTDEELAITWMEWHDFKKEI